MNQKENCRIGKIKYWNWMRRISIFRRSCILCSQNQKKKVFSTQWVTKFSSMRFKLESKSKSCITSFPNKCAVLLGEAAVACTSTIFTRRSASNSTTSTPRNSCSRSSMNCFRWVSFTRQANAFTPSLIINSD